MEIYLSKPLDSQKTKKLKTETAEFSINNKVLVKLFQKNPKQQFYFDPKIPK